jgi:putative addiction module component (TIGR02574 family)
MPKTLGAITLDVLEMPRSQRLALARIILDLDDRPSDADAEAAWDAEIRARLKAYDEGQLETLPYETFREEMESRFGR